MANAEISQAAPAQLAVVVCYSPSARALDAVSLRLPPGSTVAQALSASGLLQRHGLVADDNLAVGVWTKLRPLDTVLRDNDRIEIYRPLTVDPKEARRQRYRKQPPKRRQAGFGGGAP